MPTLSSMLSIAVAGLARAHQPAENASIVSIPTEYTYLLPDGFDGNSNYTFVNGTTTSNSTINRLFASAKAAPFISYDQEFTDLVGPNPEIKLIEERPEGHDFAYEMGVWVPERNSVWFTSSVSGDRIPPALYELDLESNEISEVPTKTFVTNPNGGYYFEGKVYIATYPNNQSYSGGVVSVDVKTLEVETITNSYFGLRYNGMSIHCCHGSQQLIDAQVSTISLGAPATASHTCTTPTSTSHTWRTSTSCSK